MFDWLKRRKVTSNPATVQIHISHDDRVKGNAGVPELQVAATTGFLPKVRELLGKGADVHARDNEGNTALRVCATVEIASLLIQKGADVNARNDAGLTALHYASMLMEGYGDPLVRFYLANGAILDVVGSAGVTPLLVALGHGNKAQAKRLLDAGATVTAQRSDGMNALDIAIQKCPERDIVQILAAKGLRLNYKLLGAFDRDFLNQLLRQTGLN